MKHILFFGVLFFIILDLFSQEAKFIKGTNYCGYIFFVTHNCMVGIEDQVSKYMPNDKVVEDFESELRNEVIVMTDSLVDQGKGCPDIKRKLQKYCRQYFGFTNSVGERVLYVNFVWSKSGDHIMKKIDNEWIGVYGGCARYWNIKYNVSNNKFYDLRVNERD